MKCFKLFLLLIFLLFTTGLASAYAMTTADYITVTEDWNEMSSVEFTVDTSYTDIVAFAVGSAYALDIAETDYSDWLGVVIVNHQTKGWVILNDDYSYSDIPEFITDAFLTELTNADYIRAFLYYSESGSSALNTGLTEGFSAYAFGNDSTYVALRSTESTLLSGETTIPSVPVPGAGILLFSGLIGLAGSSRRR